MRTRYPLLQAAVLLALLAGTGSAAAQEVFINEIHYDNDGGDTGEFVEVAGPAGTDLAGWSIALYNGANGSNYSTINLSGTIPDQENGFGTLDFDKPGIQNGAPDGLALVDADDNVVQFLSYEGTFTASGGPADGMTSTDIGVSESSSTPAGFSLQLAGVGNEYDDFSWTGPADESPGAVNAAQTFVTFDIECEESDESVTLKDANGRDHTITYCGSGYDAINDETTFKYKVTEESEGLSHWVLELCVDDLKDGEDGEPGSDIASFSPAASAEGVEGVEFGTDPTTGVTGIKWDLEDDYDEDGGEEGDMREFTVTLNGFYGEESVDVGVKGGGGSSGTTGQITGPSCDAVCVDTSPPAFDGQVIRDEDRRLIEITAEAGTDEIEFYATTNLVVGNPEGATRNALGFSTSTGPNGGTLFTLNDPATVVRFPLTTEDPNNGRVTFFIAITDECGRTTDIDPQFSLATSAEGELSADLAVRVAPNPAAGRAAITFGLAEAAPVTVAVYDALGRRVAVLAEGAHTAGAHEVTWDAGAAPVGVYVVRVEGGGTIRTARITLVR